jgi:hypothetical protein
MSKQRQRKRKLQAIQDLNRATLSSVTKWSVEPEQAAGEREMRRLLEQIQVVSDEEAEQADMVICLPDSGPRYFADDVRATCAICGIPIRHRPHVPKRPPKVCINCAQGEIEKDKEKDKAT